MDYENKVKTVQGNGMTIHHVPYKQHDYICPCGCGELMESMSGKTIVRKNFLLKKYMPEHGLTEFDFTNIESLEEECKQWWFIDRKS